MRCTKYLSNDFLKKKSFTRFLYTSPLELAGMKVLDLGCGAALPGLYCFSKGAEGGELGFDLDNFHDKKP